MTNSSTGARHRAARRPSTPLDAFGATITESITGPVGRRTAVAVASSGLILGIAAPSASAAPQETVALPEVNVASLTQDARDALATAPTVSVDAEASFSFAAVEVSSEAPPEPEPEPEPVRTDDTASRGGDRSAEAAPAAPAAPIASATAAAVIEIAYRYIGTPYVHGGAAPGGFDCSGFTSYVFAQVGVSLPRSSSAQRYAGTVVSAAEAQPGDLIWSPGHVGIYLGNGQHIAARNYSTPLSAGPIYMSNPVFIRVL
ncbi:NLP/P60 protein [Beutenbergia cavernae DSM 12333]|uniref:NLP/P60 protein n=1 Tax=Beutenbergia cavernae (strain ATCC BAA-8 / DSM 12333 / CCUG 43141 / JCM 11478 / NBRC 16432 / NCIMB 13614 / HKI 0122) TaxID=471853 RepID=C5BZH2_BEUC1|nr:C40 family peptidase [Beutenbergia cavernae]ACQ79144.1 NLP/P60 protein [Beutenbergia cavernae DSM 12333]